MNYGTYEQRGISIRGLEAHADGRVPISGVDRKWLDAAGIAPESMTVSFARWLLTNVNYSGGNEWHHTGKYAARTNFYDGELLADYWNGKDADRQSDLRRKYKAYFRKHSQHREAAGKEKPVPVIGWFSETPKGSRSVVEEAFTGVLKGGWIHLDGRDGRKKPDAMHIHWTSTSWARRKYLSERDVVLVRV